jgi:hypothetical protein
MRDFAAGLGQNPSLAVHGKQVAGILQRDQVFELVPGQTFAGAFLGHGGLAVPDADAHLAVTRVRQQAIGDLPPAAFQRPPGIRPYQKLAFDLSGHAILAALSQP